MADVVFASVGKIFGDGTRALSNFSAEVTDGEFLVLVGPSGCGKTTALRIVAGLEEPTEGEIRIGGEVVTRRKAADRDVAMVFQNYALYPHMSVHDNIGFALRMRKVPRREIRRRVEEIAGVLDLREVLHRRPGALSGGQRQRVAMGRAIIRDPSVFLLDEPLSNLDARLRVQMRAEIARIQREVGATTIYVTHDQVEAMTMADRVAVLRKGELQQIDRPRRVYDAPANLFVASFIGSPSMNLLAAKLERGGDGLSCAVGAQSLPLPGDATRARPQLADYVGKTIALGIRPEHVVDASLARVPVDRCTLSGVVQLTEELGSELLAHVELSAEPVATAEVLEVARDLDDAALGDLRSRARTRRAAFVARLDPDSSARAGEKLDMAVDTTKLHFFDLESGAAIATSS